MTDKIELLAVILEAVKQGKTVTITADEIVIDADESTWSNPSITIE